MYSHMMNKQSSTLAVIGGSGLYSLRDSLRADANPSDTTTHQIKTPYASQPVTLYLEHTAAGPVWFLPRHGREHTIAPHEINYRANISALQQVGVQKIIAVNAVGGISKLMTPGVMVLPDQLIDYSWGREHTFFTGTHGLDKHVDFIFPYAAALATLLTQAALSCDLTVQTSAVYACTQGPRLETAAEIRRLARDGCDIVGMTGMPEAALARELQLSYGCIALVVNKAAGLGGAVISFDEMKQVMQAGIENIRKLLLAAVPLLLAAE